MMYYKNFGGSKFTGLLNQIADSAGAWSLRALNATYRVLWPAVDQAQTTISGGRNNVETAWQSFTAGGNGILSQIDIYASGYIGTFVGDLKIYAGEGVTATLLGTKTGVVLNATLGWYSFDISSLLVEVTAENVYSFVFTRTSGSQFYTIHGTPNLYAGGRCNIDPAYDFTFRTYIGQSTAESSPLIRVRRSSDNTEKDIGITTKGDLNIADFFNFISDSSAGYITTFYDQTLNNRNISNTVASGQGRLQATLLKSGDTSRKYNIFDTNVPNYITIPNDTSNTGIFATGGSVEFDIFPNGGQSVSGVVLAKRAATGNAWEVMLSTDCILKLNLTRSTTTQVFDYQLAYRQWQTVKITYDLSNPDTAPTIVVNGVSGSMTLNNAGSGTYATESGDMWVGNKSTLDANLHGVVENISFYKGETKTASYENREQSGTTVSDSVGAVHGTMTKPFRMPSGKPYMLSIGSSYYGSTFFKGYSETCFSTVHTPRYTYNESVTTNAYDIRLGSLTYTDGKQWYIGATNLAAYSDSVTIRCDRTSNQFVVWSYTLYQFTGRELLVDAFNFKRTGVYLWKEGTNIGRPDVGVNGGSITSAQSPSDVNTSGTVSTALAMFNAFIGERSLSFQEHIIFSTSLSDSDMGLLQTDQGNYWNE